MMQGPTPYTIRPMQPGDIPTVVAIDRLSFPNPWPASAYLYEIRKKKSSYYYVLLKPETDEDASSEQGWYRWLHRAILAEQSPVIGYVGFRIRDYPLRAHISTIAIHPNWRGKGLGELMLITALERALELGLDIISLEVRASNRVAQRMYRKYDFQFTDVKRGYYRDGEDAQIMTLELEPQTYQNRLAELRQALEAQIQRQRKERANVL